MSKLFLSSFLLIGLFLFAGCGGDDSNPVAPIPDPIASFTFTGTTVTPATITFTNTSENADSYYWDFGDGSSSIQESPQHTYNTHDTYTVTLVAEATSTGKEDRYTKTITITPGKCYLDSVIIVAMPFTDTGGAGWDLASGPDLIFELTHNGNTFKRWGPIDDLAPSDLPIRGYVSSPYEITDWSFIYFIKLYDYDDLSANDVIGWPDGFSINQVIDDQGYVESFEREGWYDNSIKVRIAIHWE